MCLQHKKITYQSVLRSQQLSIDLTMTAQGAFFPQENFKDFPDTECKSSVVVMMIYYDAGRSK